MTKSAAEKAALNNNGSAGSSPKKRIDRKRFEEWLEELVRVLRPHTILVYGSANYPCFEKLLDRDIKVVVYIISVTYNEKPLPPFWDSNGFSS